MIWLIIAVIGSPLCLIAYIKTRSVNAVVGFIAFPVIGFLVGLIFTTAMRLSYLGPV
jgi:Cu/Ag efflux pump CusA